MKTIKKLIIIASMTVCATQAMDSGVSYERNDELALTQDQPQEQPTNSESSMWDEILMDPELNESSEEDDYCPLENEGEDLSSDTASHAPLVEKTPRNLTLQEQTALAEAIEQTPSKQDRVKYPNLKQNRLLATEKKKKPLNAYKYKCVPCKWGTDDLTSFKKHNKKTTHMEIQGRVKCPYSWEEHKWQCVPCKFGGDKRIRLKEHNLTKSHKKKVGEEELLWHQQPNKCLICKWGTPRASELNKHLKSGKKHLKKLKEQEDIESNIPSKSEDTEVTQ